VQVPRLRRPPGLAARRVLCGWRSDVLVVVPAGIIRRHGDDLVPPSLVLLEHTGRQAHQEEEHLDLVRIGRDGQPHWTRVWPAGEDNPRHAGLQAGMTAYGR
jgi:hypothetical protein